MNRSSSCPRCDREKHGSHFACSRCWWLLPAEIRQAIWRTYRHEGVLSEAYEAAAEDAERYWRDNHPLEHDPPEPPEQVPGQLSLEESA